MIFPVSHFTSRGQEKRFQAYLGYLSIKTDIWCSAIILAGLTSVLPKMTYVGEEGTFMPQAVLWGGIYVAHLLPPLVIWTRGKDYYVRWREVILLSSMALDWIALLKMRCWILMPDVQDEQKMKLAFQIYNMCTGHLVLISLGRNLPFKHHLVGNAALLGSALHALWRHCLGLGCKYGSALRDFRQAADAFLLPLNWALDLNNPTGAAGWSTGLGGSLEGGPRLGNTSSAPGGEVLTLESCRENCFVVHGTTAVVVGFFIPLVIVFKREQTLRRRFLEDEARRARSRRQVRALEALARLASGGPGQRWWNGPVGLCLVSNAVMLYSLVLSVLCWVVQVLARGGMAAILGTAPDKCPGKLPWPA